MHKILAVDDEAYALKALKLQLESVDYNVITASNGEEAISALVANPDIDCILLDRMMPKMDGMELLKRLKLKDSPYRHIPVIMQTAKRQDHEAYEGIDAGAVNYLIKPYDRETLLASVEAVLRDMDALKAHVLQQLQKE